MVIFMREVSINEEKVKARAMINDGSLFALKALVKVDERREVLVSATQYKIVVVYRERVGKIGIVSVKFETKNYADILKDIRFSDEGDAKTVLQAFANVFSVLRLVIPKVADPIPQRLREDPETLLLIAVEEIKKALR